MQFLMTFTNITKFAEDNWMHAYSQECNVVDQFEGYDRYIALVASIEAWMVFVPLIYELSKVLVPGIPCVGGTDSIEDVDKKRDPKSMHLHFLKYITVISPDLLLSVLASWWMQIVSNANPKTYERNEVGYVEEPIKSCRIEYNKYKVVFEHGVYVRRAASYDENIEKMAAIECGEFAESCSDISTQDVECPPDSECKYVTWIQLISHQDGWVPLTTPNGEAVLQLISENVQEHENEPSTDFIEEGDVDMIESIEKGDVRSRRKHRSSSAAICYDGDVKNMIRIQSDTVRYDPAFRVVSSGK
jgi:hypothetical protein